MRFPTTAAALVLFRLAGLGEAGGAAIASVTAVTAVSAAEGNSEESYGIRPGTETSAPLPDSPIEAGVNRELVPNRPLAIGITGIIVTLIEAHGPPPGCRDCPLKAVLEVGSSEESVTIAYSFSPNMLPELLAKSRKKEAYGFTFTAVRIVEGSLTIRVEPTRTKEVRDE